MLTLFFGGGKLNQDSHDQILPLTVEGGKRLALILRQTRYGSGMKQGEFQRQVGISHSTIANIENKKLNSIRLSTLQKLAPYTDYTESELISICSGGKAVLTGQDREYRAAEDAWSVLEQMPPSEVELLIERAIAEMPLLRRQLIKLLRAIIDKLED